MIGQSSSHTAGAVRIGLVARAVLGTPPQKADIELHGSVAATGKGHATDRALVAGLLGFLPDDERIKDSLAFAADAGLRVSFSSVDLGEEVHPNSARITMESSEGASCRFVGKVRFYSSRYLMARTNSKLFLKKMKLMSPFLNCSAKLLTWVILFL